MKSLFLSAILAVSLFASSCNKEEAVNPDVVDNVSKTLLINESYLFEVPKSISGDDFKISTQATNYEVSKLTTKTDGTVVYQYTPKLDFVGTDVVTLTAVGEEEEEDDRNMECPNGNSKTPKVDCGTKSKKEKESDDDDEEDDDDEVKHTININLTIKKAETL